MQRLAFVVSGLGLVFGTVGCGSVSGAPDGGGGRGGGSAGAGGGSAGAGGTSGPVDGGVCTFAMTYTIIDGGGLVAMQDMVTLSFPASFHYVRDTFRQDAGQLSCDPPMPACGDPTRIDSQDVEIALSHPDVEAALAMTTVPFYGNRGVADGPNFNFMRADGRGFNAGLNCDTPSTTCTPIPPGINALVTLLRDLIRQQRMDPACSAIVN
jgi:hypothetical protein